MCVFAAWCGTERAPRFGQFCAGHRHSLHIFGVDTLRLPCLGLPYPPKCGSHGRIAVANQPPPPGVTSADAPGCTGLRPTAGRLQRGGCSIRAPILIKLTRWASLSSRTAYISHRSQRYRRFCYEPRWLTVIRSVRQYGETALMYAAVTGKSDAARLLLEHGASVNMSSKVGCLQNPLQCHASLSVTPPSSG